MKVVLAGGSGFIGKRLIEELATAQHSVVLLTRSRSLVTMNALPTVQVRQWDAKTHGSWATEMDGADAVINLAGESLGGKRWTREQKERIIDSRVNATRAIVGAIKQAKRRPPVLVNASAVGYYGNVENNEVTESSKRGDGFLPTVVETWENEARSAESLGVRVVMLRNGVVLGKGGGALEKLMLPFKMFVGGPVGSGRQWFPWVHRDDVIKVVFFVMENSSISGPVNVAAPDSVTMKQFCEVLGKSLRRPSWMPVPGILLQIAFGEMSEMVLTGQRVIPTRLLQSGFKFDFPELDGALTDIFS